MSGRLQELSKSGHKITFVPLANAGQQWSFTDACPQDGVPLN